MIDIQEISVPVGITIREALKRIESTGNKILFVMDGDYLKGTFVDGDMRRWVLKGGSLDAFIDEAMNPHPIVIKRTDISKAKEVLMSNRLLAAPVVDEENRLISGVFWHEEEMGVFRRRDIIDIPVVIMAGGGGERLRPYTKVLPKPLIPIGNVPIVDRVIDSFYFYGCTKFILSINYMKNLIKAYFADSSKKIDIDYIEETKPLGTAGSLGLLKDKITDSFFVSNCDILVDTDYSAVVAHHKNEKNAVTVVGCLKNTVIPYGIMNLDETGSVKSIKEKPETSSLIITGVYLLEPYVLKLIPEETKFDMPQLLNACINNNYRVGVFPVRDGAMKDMGQIDELDRMRKFYSNEDGEV